MRFSIRSLFIFHLVFGLILALCLVPVWRVWSRASVVHALRSNGFFVVFDVPGVSSRSCFWCELTAACFGEDGVTLVNIVRFQSQAGTIESANAFRGISTLSEVTQVSLEDADWVGDENLRVLVALHDLQSLNLSGTRITSRAIYLLNSLPSLECLFLCDTRVDDECVLSLCKMRQLRLIDITGTDISSAGVSQLRTALPDCAIRCDK